jgi:hypothetical protein
MKRRTNQNDTGTVETRKTKASEAQVLLVFTLSWRFSQSSTFGIKIVALRRCSGLVYDEGGVGKISRVEIRRQMM